MTGVTVRAEFVIRGTPEKGPLNKKQKKDTRVYPRWSTKGCPTKKQQSVYSSACTRILIERAAQKWTDSDQLNRVVCYAGDEASFMRLLDAGASVKFAVVAAAVVGMPARLIGELLGSFTASSSDRPFFESLLAVVSDRMQAHDAAQNDKDMWEYVRRLSGIDLNDADAFAAVLRRSGITGPYRRCMQCANWREIVDSWR